MLLGGFDSILFEIKWHLRVATKDCLVPELIGIRRHVLVIRSPSLNHNQIHRHIHMKLDPVSATVPTTAAAHHRKREPV